MNWLQRKEQNHVLQLPRFRSFSDEFEIISRCYAAVNMEPFQGSNLSIRLCVGALPRPNIYDAFSVSLRKWLSLKGTNITAEGNALGNQTNHGSQTLKGFHNNARTKPDSDCSMHMMVHVQPNRHQSKPCCLSRSTSGTGLTSERISFMDSTRRAMSASNSSWWSE